MAKLTSSQMEFARGMNQRQWATLRALAMFPFYMSASERGDPETYALVRHGLASAGSGVLNGAALFMWEATEAGKTVLAQRDKGAGPSPTPPTCGTRVARKRSS